MTAVDDLIAKIREYAWGDSPAEMDVQLEDVVRLICAAFVPGGLCFTRAQVVDQLNSVWRDCRDDGAGIQRLQSIVRFLFLSEILTEDDAELWHRRAETCPGHGDEGGRDWCAYGCARDAFRSGEEPR